MAALKWIVGGLAVAGVGALLFMGTRAPVDRMPDLAVMVLGGAG